MYNKKGNVRVM